MSRTILNFLVAAAMVVGIGSLVYAQKQSAVSIVKSTNTTSVITLADVASHNAREDCWTVINGGIYDLTSWIPEHPGGEQAILQLCGTDGSQKFNGMHGGASRQETILAGFKIGELSGDAHD